MANPINKRPDGFHTVNPYLVVSGAEKVLAFLIEAFDAKEVGEAFKAPDGKIAHATVRIGDSMIEMGDGPEPMPMNLHMYVDDVDGMYRRAIAAGAESIRDVIAFPKAASGHDPLTGAPTTITPQQRKEAGIDVKPAPPAAGSADPGRSSAT